MIKSKTQLIAAVVLVLTAMFTIQTKSGVQGWTLQDYSQQARRLSAENYYASNYGGYQVSAADRTQQVFN